MASNNVQNWTLADSFVIRLPPETVSACQLGNRQRLAKQLTLLHGANPGQKKPVVFYRELLGTKNRTECDTYWDSVECETE